MMRLLTVMVLIGSAFPGSAGAQLIYLKMADVHGDVPAQVTAPRNYLEQIRNGTLDQLEFVLPAGSLNDAFAKANAGSKRLNSLTARVPDGDSRYVEIRMKNATITSYNIGSSGLDTDRWARVKVQFHWDPSGTDGHIEIGALKAGSSDAPAPPAATFNGGILWVNDTGMAFNVVAPADFLVRLRDGTLRTISLQLGPGPLKEQLAQAHRTRRALPSIRVQLNDGAGAVLEIRLERVYVTSYSINASGDSPPQVTFVWGGMTRI